MSLEREETIRVAIFDGSIFVAWKFRMLTLLEEHELMECIETEVGNVAEFKVEPGDSVEVRLTKSKALEKRQKRDRKCKSLIVSRIHDDQLEHLQGRENPKQMWDALVRIFERKSVAKRLHLNREMHDLRYTGGSLQDHFIRFDRLIRLYRNAGGTMDDIDVVCRLLLSLGSEYEAVVTSIESQPEEHLTMDFVKCRLLDEEIKRKSTTATSGGVNGNVKSEAAFSGGAQRKPAKKKKIFKCFSCQKEGHKASKIEAAGMRVVYEDGRVEIQRGSKVVATGQRRDKLYELNFYAAKGECSSIYFSGQISKATEL